MSHQQKIKSTADPVPGHVASLRHSTGVAQPGLLMLTATGRSDSSSFGKKLNLGADQKGSNKHIRIN